MNEQLTRHVHDMFAAVTDIRIPDHVQAIAKDGVSKTRASYERVTFLSKERTRAFEQAIVAAQAGVKTIGEKILQHSEANTEAFFDTAHAMARAKTPSELARLQGSFVVRQFTVAGAQVNELAELSAKVAQQTIASVNNAVAKSFEHLKTSADQ